MSVSNHEQAYRAFIKFKADNGYEAAKAFGEAGNLDNAIWTAFVAGFQAGQNESRILEGNKNRSLGALWRSLRVRLWPQDSGPSRVSPSSAGCA